MHRYSPAAENFIHPLRGKGREQGAGSREQGKTEKLGTRNLMPRRGIIIIAAVTPAG